MLKSRKVKDIVNEKVGRVAKAAAKVGVDFDMESIHHFRVQVKGLRSFAKLPGVFPCGMGPKSSKKIKRLYEIAGDIRSAQLELLRLKKNTIIFSEYLEALKQNIVEKKKEWNEIYSAKILSWLQKRSARFPHHACGNDILRQFLSERIEYMAEIGRNKSPSDSQLHNVRKKVKDILCIFNVIEDNMRAMSKITKKVPKKQLERLASIIGKYNDDRMLTVHLSAFALHIDGVGQKGFKRFCSAVEHRLTREREEIILMLAEI